MTAERQLKAPIKSFTPDYSLLGRLPAVLLESSVGTLDLEMDASLGCNNLNKTSSVDSATQNNGTIQEEDIPDSPLIKFGRQISAGVSSERRLKNSSRSPPPFSSFAEETTIIDQTKIVLQTSRTSDILSPTTMHHRSRQKRELPRAVVEGGLEFQTEGFSVFEENRMELKEMQTRSVTLPGDEDHLVRAASRYFGIPFRRKKFKQGMDIDCDRSEDEPMTAKKQRSLPKIVRRLRQALSKRLVQQHDSSAVLLKTTIDDVLSMQVAAMSDKKSSEKSLSDDVSDVGSIDIEDIKLGNPELYTSIIETVAGWCKAPDPEPGDEEADDASIKTFSSISFRERGRRESQDLTHFEVGTALAVEEAFLNDVMEGKIDNASDTSETCSHVSVDREIQEATTPKSIRSTAESNQAVPVVTPLPSSFLHLTDSESDDEEITNHKENDFLHLTSSEMESMEMNSMKEVLKMQGVWLFDWERCDHIKNLPRSWSKSSCLRKYLDAADGIEIVVEGRIVKCLRYPSTKSHHRASDEYVYIDDRPPNCPSDTFSIKGTLTSMGLRTKCTFPEDESRREELVWIEGGGLCVQVVSELPSGDRNVSRVYLSRPINSV